MIHYYLRTNDSHCFRVDDKILFIGYIRAKVLAKWNKISPEEPIFLPDTNSFCLRIILKWIGWYKTQRFYSGQDLMTLTDWEIEILDKLSDDTLLNLLIATKTLMVPEMWAVIIKYVQRRGCLFLEEIEGESSSSNSSKSRVEYAFESPFDSSMQSPFANSNNSPLGSIIDTSDESLTPNIDANIFSGVQLFGEDSTDSFEYTED